MRRLTRRDRDSLDRHITGNWGEGSVPIRKGDKANWREMFDAQRAEFQRKRINAGAADPDPTAYAVEGS